MLLAADHEPASVSMVQGTPCGAMCRTYLQLTLGIKQSKSSLCFKIIVTFLHKVPRCYAMHHLAVTLREHTDMFPTPFPPATLEMRVWGQKQMAAAQMEERTSRHCAL